MKRILSLVPVLALVLVACSGEPIDISDVPDLPVVTAEDLETTLEAIDGPAIVNVWASWCIPCRSEAPLLTAAHEAHGDEIEFIGVDVQDNQPNAKAFIVEFEVEFANVFDRNRTIPSHYGAIGTPITFFFGPGGELLNTHSGVIDERTLALGIDELLRLGS